ncbi:ABC transporter permease [Cellulomonas bogoriensis]|uniref:Membrane protein n=1 Tax=Cellulomonas bogoriensis 69B4 = DSM 16987 TaxID=1386082 RepID=A0A0A0BLN2_9CELL|nr:ABC transporter permease [Cellulomonas bogoriensis]KGM09438.1 membrane protein [Cellulomonas bogoriensis 69B4 = DSM 16987]
MSTGPTSDPAPGTLVTDPAPTPPAPGTWGLTWHGVRTVATLELRQRIRSTRWIVSLVVFGLLVGGVTTLTYLVAISAGPAVLHAGQMMFGFIVFFVLFLGLLVSPTLSATAINGDRNAGTLATLQVTLLSAAEIVVGKLVASWVASLAFLAVSVPFLLWAFLMGDTPVVAVLVTLLLLAVTLAVVCAVGLGFSALTARTAGSAVLTYVTVASLTALSLVVFGLTLGLVSGSETRQVYRENPQTAYEWQDADGTWHYEHGECTLREETRWVSHTDRTWWLLAINPFVVVADAMPSASSDDGFIGPRDPMSLIRYGVRVARLGPADVEVEWGCDDGSEIAEANARDYEDVDALSPAWPWGLGAHLLLGLGSVAFAIRRLGIPQRRLPKGTRVA